MKFFLDENFPKSSEVILNEFGHKVFDIRGTSSEGLSDLEIFKLAQEKNAVFLTTDKDFFNTIPFQFEEHSVASLFRLDFLGTFVSRQKCPAGGK